PAVQPFVHLGHEGMEVDPPLAFDRGCFEKEVHEHGLAAPDRPVEVEPLRRLRPPPRQAEPFLPARSAARRTVVTQGVVERLQLLRRQLLRPIRLDFARAHPAAIGMNWLVAHPETPHRSNWRGKDCDGGAGSRAAKLFVDTNCVASAMAFPPAA